MTKFITIHTPSVYCHRPTEVEEVVINADNIVCFNNEGIELDTGTKIRTIETLKEIKELLK